MAGKLKGWQLTASGIVISLISTLSKLWLKMFQRIWFCTAWTDPLLPGLELLTSSGMCSKFLNNKRQLLMFVHWPSVIFDCCLKYVFFLKKSISTLVACSSVKDFLMDASKLFNSYSVCLPKFDCDINSTDSKHSIGVVKLTSILIINSIVSSSFAFNKRGIRSFCRCCPKLIILRYGRR